MKRIVLSLLALLALAGVAGVQPAKAAPPKPQCIDFISCDEGPVQRIIRICQSAYCQFP